MGTPHRLNTKRPVVSTYSPLLFIYGLCYAHSGMHNVTKKISRWVFMLATRVCAFIRDLFVWVSAIQIQETVQNGSQKVYF